MKNKFLKNVTKVLFGNITTIISGVLIGFLLPMLISVKDYGYYKIFTLYMSYIGCFALGIIDGINLKYAGKKLEELNKKDFRLFFKVLVILHVIISLLILLLSCLFLEDNMKIIFVLLGLMIIPNNISGYFQQVSQATQRFSEYAIRNVVKSVGNILILLILFAIIKTNHIISYRHYIILYLLVNIILFIWYIVTYRNIVFGEHTDFKDKKSEIADFIKAGFPLMISNLCATLILTIDRQFVSIIFSKEEYAIYAFAYNLLSLITIAVSSISVVLFPMLKQEKSDQLSTKYDNYVSLIMILVGALLISYFPLSKLIMLILPKYTESLLYFKIMFPSLIGSTVITAIMHNYYKSIGKNMLFFKKSMVVLFISIVANIIAYLLLPQMIAFSIATVIITIIWYIYVERTLAKEMNVKWFKNLTFYILLMISFYFTVFMFNNLLISSLIYCIVFLLFCYTVQNNALKNALKIIIRKET